MIPENQRFIDALTRRYFSDPEPNGNGHSSPNGRASASVLTDEEVLHKLFAERRNGEKWRAVFTLGPEGNYPSNSEAVAALLRKLAFYTGHDAAQIDRIIRESALNSSKFDARRGAESWIAAEIKRAIADTPEVYAAADRNPNRNSNREDFDLDSKPQLRAVRFSEMGAPKPRRHLVAGIVPMGYPTIVYGDGGVAKSIVMLSMGQAIARGAESWLGHAIEGCPVLCLDFELDDQEQSRRAHQVARAEGLTQPPADLLYMGALGFKPREAFKEGLQACKEHGVKLAIIDSLGPAMEGDMEASRDVIGLYQRVLEPFRAAGITVVAVDHQSKLQAGERYQSKSAFGSVFKGNLARSVLQVEAINRDPGELTLRVRQKKYNFGTLADPFGIKLTFTEEAITLDREKVSAEDLRGEDTLNDMDRVLLALLEAPAFPDELQERTGLSSRQVVRNNVAKLKKSGRAEETGVTGPHGAVQVRITDAGKQRAARLQDRNRNSTFKGFDLDLDQEEQADDRTAEEF